jgi:hypothetical protein
MQGGSTCSNARDVEKPTVRLAMSWLRASFTAAAVPTYSFLSVNCIRGISSRLTGALPGCASDPSPAGKRRSESTFPPERGQQMGCLSMLGHITTSS